jgi:chromosome segregation ATPase
MTNKCWSCGDTGSSAIRDCPYCEEIELADLRAKLAAATERAEKAELAAQEQRLLTETVRAGMQSLGRTLEDCRLDKHAVEVERDSLKAAVEKLDADLRFQRDDRDHWHREEGLKSVKLAEAKFSAEKAESKLAEAITRAEAAEAERDVAKAERDALAAQNERLRAAAELAECYAKALRRSLEKKNQETFPGSEDQAEVDDDLATIAGALSLTPPAAVAEARERDAGLLALVERLRAALGAWQRHMKTCSNPAEVPWVEKLATLCEAEQLAAEALALTPPAALEELRRRERSIGAEEELRRIIYDLVGCYTGPSSTTITAGELDARADQIRDAREKGL